MIKARTLPFNRIARRYQTVNSILSFGMDSLWRKRLIGDLCFADGMSVLDIGVGTGDLLEIIPAQDTLKVGIDPERAMMDLNPEIEFNRIIGIGETLPFPDNSFDRVISAFVLRNLTDRATTFREIQRVLKPGGQGGILEMSPPDNPLLKTGARTYIKHIVPAIGSVVSGDSAAYKYLAGSIMNFPLPGVIVGELQNAGLANVEATRLIGGVTVFYRFSKG